MTSPRSSAERWAPVLNLISSIQAWHLTYHINGWKGLSMTSFSTPRSWIISKDIHTQHLQGHKAIRPTMLRSGGRLCTRFLGSQVHADGSGPGSQVHADGSGQGRKGNGLVCTRGQGPHLYTRPRASSVHAEWFCCMYTFVLTAVYFVCSMCAGCQVHNNAFWTCVKYVPKQSIAQRFEHVCKCKRMSSSPPHPIPCDVCAGDSGWKK